MAKDNQGNFKPQNHENNQRKSNKNGLPPAPKFPKSKKRKKEEMEILAKARLKNGDQNMLRKESLYRLLRQQSC